MKTLFFGTSEFALPSLRALAAGSDVRGVVTQPDRPAGRGHKMRSTPVKAAAIEMHLPVYEPQSLRAFARQIAGDGYDLFVLASFGRILPASLLRVPRLGALNVHPSLLPRYRGATPLQSALRDGARETGVTIMLMDAGMDTGDVVLQERTAIGEDETYGQLHDRLARQGAALLERALAAARGGTLAHHPQQGEPSLTAPLRAQDLAVDWSWDARRIVNAVRAYSPQPAARAQLAGDRVKIVRARGGPKVPAGIAPGEAIGVFGDALRVASGDGSVDVLELIAPNRPKMNGANYAGARGKRSS